MQRVRTDHGRSDVTMPQQLLDSSNARTGLAQRGIIVPIVHAVYTRQEQTARIFRGSTPTVKSYHSLADAIEATAVLGIQLASQPIASRLFVF